MVKPINIYQGALAVLSGAAIIGAIPLGPLAMTNVVSSRILSMIAMGLGSGSLLLNLISALNCPSKIKGGIGERKFTHLSLGFLGASLAALGALGFADIMPKLGFEIGTIAVGAAVFPVALSLYFYNRHVRLRKEQDNFDSKFSNAKTPSEEEITFNATSKTGGDRH